MADANTQTSNARATVISFCPFPIRETKPGMFPQFYNIDKAGPKDPKIIHIADAYFFERIPGTPRKIKGWERAETIAASIVHDFNKSQLGYSDTSCPALLWFEGKLSIPDILKTKAVEIQEALDRQKNWFVEIIRIGDDDWGQTKRHTVITNIQREACRILGVSRDWMNLENSVQEQSQNTKCPSCGSVVMTNIAKCPSCKVILNEELYKKFKYAE